MVAAWLKSAPLMLKATPVAKKQRPHRQNVFSQHQNASTVPTRPPGLRNFARGSIEKYFSIGQARSFLPKPVSVFSYEVLKCDCHARCSTSLFRSRRAVI
jgi:hypothetical protein